MAVAELQGEGGKTPWVYDTPLRKYVSSRQATNEEMKVVRTDILCALLTLVDDFMDILIESTPGAMKLRDRAHDKKLTQDLGRVGCELAPQLIWPSAVQELCWGQVV